MRGLLYILSTLAVIGLAYWAYMENYRTKAAMDELRSLQARSGEIRESLAQVNAFLAERISGIEVVQLFNHHKETERRFIERLAHVEVHPQGVVRLARLRLELGGAFGTAPEDFLGEDCATAMVGQLADVTEDDLNLELLRLVHRLPRLEDGVDLVLGQVVPRHIVEFAATTEELTQQRVGDLLEDFSGFERLGHRCGSLPRVLSVARCGAAASRYPASQPSLVRLFW